MTHSHPLASPEAQPSLWSPRFVLFEDDDIIVVHKPSGLPTQPTVDPKRDNLFYAVGRYLGQGAYLGLHHRLDVGTSGIVILTKNRAANPRIAQDFKERRIHKQYYAISASRIMFENSFEFLNYIAEIKNSNPQKYECVTKGGRVAHTIGEIQERIDVGGYFILGLSLSPLTGRTHQLRVHLSHAGAPILGDNLYRSRDPLPRFLRALLPNRLCLHAQKLTFQHPMTREEITIEDPIPTDFVRFLAQCKKFKA